MAINQQDIIRQEPWFVTSLIRDWYFENYTKKRAEALGRKLLEPGAKASDANWASFISDPKTLPVYTKKQLNAMLGNAGLNLLEADNRAALFSYLNYYPKHALQKLDLTKVLHEKLNLKESKDKLSYAFIDEYAKDLFYWAPKFLQAANYEDLLVWASSSQSVSRELKESSDLSKKAVKYTFGKKNHTPDQRACFAIAEHLWDTVNPENQWWAIFDFLPFVKKIIENRKAVLIAQSPFYRAKIEGKTVQVIHDENPGYVQGFISEDNPNSNVCLQKFIESAKSDDDTQSVDSDLDSSEDKEKTVPSESDLKPKLKAKHEPEPEPKAKRKLFTHNYKVQKVTVPNAKKITIKKLLAPEVHQVVVKDIAPAPVPKLQYAKEFYTWDQKKSLSQHVKESSFARNNDPKKQFDRDVYMMQETLKKPGSDKHFGNKSALVLKKLLYTLSRADCMYKRDKQWHRFSDEPRVPLASLISHTTRILIQLPPKSNGEDAAEDFFKKFLVMHTHSRHAATHGIIVNPNPEELEGDIKKHVVEIKPGYVALAQKAAIGYITGNKLEGHYGMNLAFGGEGNRHFLSQAGINNKGENGHLYMYYLPATDTSPGSILFGIEQSAPVDTADADVIKCMGTAVYDNLGGAHDMLGTPNHYSVSGGDHFGKAPSAHKKNSDYVGLSGVGPDEYYDSMFCNLSHEQLDVITREFNEAMFDEDCLAEKPQGDLYAVGHGRMNRTYEKMVNNKMQNHKTPYLSRWLEYVGYQETEEDSPELENSFIELGDATTAENRLKIETIGTAIACLEEYPKRGDNYIFLQELVASLYRICQQNLWGELEGVVRKIESVSINGQSLIDELPEHLEPFGFPASDDDGGDPMLGTIFGYAQQVQALVGKVVRTKDVLINAHHELMKLMPEELKINAHPIKNHSH